MPDLRPIAVASIDATADALPGAFSCEVVPERDRVRIAAIGELDVASAPELEQTVRELLDVGFDHLILDLAGLSFMDSTGVQLLLDLQSDAVRGSFVLGLRPGPRAVQRIFELTGTAELLPFETTTIAAHNRSRRATAVSDRRASVTARA